MHQGPTLDTIPEQDEFLIPILSEEQIFGDNANRILRPNSTLETDLRSIRKNKRNMDQLQAQMDGINNTIQQLGNRLDNNLVSFNQSIQQTRASDHDLAIPYFSGSLSDPDFSTWIENFKVICSARLFEVDTMMRKLPAYLKDRAKDAYNSLSLQTRTILIPHVLH